MPMVLCPVPPRGHGPTRALTGTRPETKAIVGRIGQHDGADTAGGVVRSAGNEVEFLVVQGRRTTRRSGSFPRGISRRGRRPPNPAP